MTEIPSSSIDLTRGVRDVLHLCYEHLKTSPMSEMFEGHAYSPDTIVHLPTPVAARFADLATLLATSPLDSDALAHCRAALAHLEDIYKNIVHFARTAPVESGQVWRWAVAVSSAFLRLVRARVPAALVLLAHYAAANSAIRTAWYTEDWGVYALRGIEAELDAGYQHWLDWPREQSATHMGILGVKLADDDGRRPMIGF